MNFNTIGIICEYNPFHFGHKYHISEARKKSECENVVCVMSGSFVQRGEPAMFDKWKRAATAVENGADLVIEIPAMYVLQSAEQFAYGGINLLDKLNIIDGVCFGSETNDFELLNKVSEEISKPSDEYINALSQKLSEGAGYPAACEYALKTVIPDIPQSVFLPNSTLAISYMASLKKINSKISPFCIHRKNDYHSECSDDEFKSATAIRNMIDKKEDYSQYAPLYDNENIYNLKYAESYILGFFRNVSPQKLSNIAGYEDGMENLIINSAKKACSLNELFEMCTTKRYTRGRIKRFCISSILGVEKDICEPDYVRILAFNSKGATLIKKIKEHSSLIPITKTADYKGSSCFDIDVSATDLASLCSEDVGERYCGKDFLESPRVYCK